MTRIYKFRETENKLMIARGWELRGWEVTVNWYRISLEGEENYLKLIVEIVVQLCDYIKNCGASLVAQWLRICLLMQETRVRALVWEDPTCRGATRPVSHNYWTCASGACALQREVTIVRGPRTAMKSGPRLLQLEEALAQKRRPNTAKKINK